MKIGLIGLIGSGKNTVSDILEKNHRYTKDSFAKPLKDCLSSIYGWDRAMIEGDTEDSRVFRETKDQYWSDRLGRDIIPRKELQFLGTDIMREHYHKDIWVESLIARIKGKDNVVVTDVRFPNEMQALRDAGAVLVRVSRNDPEWLHSLINQGVDPKWVHVSEKEWVKRLDLINYTIYNDSHIDSLAKTVSFLVGVLGE